MFAINSESINLQSEDMHIEIAMYQLKGILAYFKNQRQNAFTCAMISAKEIANEMDVELNFREKHVIRKKRNNLVKLLIAIKTKLPKNHFELNISSTLLIKLFLRL